MVLVVGTIYIAGLFDRVFDTTFSPLEDIRLAYLIPPFVWVFMALELMFVLCDIIGSGKVEDFIKLIYNKGRGES